MLAVSAVVVVQIPMQEGAGSRSSTIVSLSAISASTDRLGQSRSSWLTTATPVAGGGGGGGGGVSSRTTFGTWSSGQRKSRSQTSSGFSQGASYGPQCMACSEH